MFWLPVQMLGVDETSGECDHIRMKEGEELFKLKDTMLAQEMLGIGCGQD